jgi:protein tyrosine phosphatase (PTP) superfamily phosphohydrolase (DUF442 family)
MKSNNSVLLSLAMFTANCFALEEPAADLAAINNFRQYSPVFASAGQPTREQFQVLKDNGFERVVYIAFSNVGAAISDEDAVVKGLGMEYLHVPVDFNQPLAADFYAFADSMQRAQGKKTLLHCQVNARATAFSFLYRVIYDELSVEQAKADMNTVWQPNAVWRDFIFAVLADNGKSPDCAGCDWTPPPPRQAQ